MLLDAAQIEKCQEKCNDIVRLLVTDQIKHDYPEGKQLVNLSHTFVISYHESFCYHGEACNHGIVLADFVIYYEWLLWLLTGYVNEEELMKLLESPNKSSNEPEDASCDTKEEVRYTG